jgi:hypothetical protein
MDAVRTIQYLSRRDRNSQITLCSCSETPAFVSSSKRKLLYSSLLQMVNGVKKFLTFPPPSDAGCLMGSSMILPKMKTRNAQMELTGAPFRLQSKIKNQKLRSRFRLCALRALRVSTSCKSLCKPQQAFARLRKARQGCARLNFSKTHTLDINSSFKFL